MLMFLSEGKSQRFTETAYLETNYLENISKMIKEKVEKEMDLAYSIVKLGRSARNSSNMKNRQPLSKMLISVDTLPEYYGNIVKE